MATLADEIVCRRLPEKVERIAARDSLLGVNVSSITTAMAILEGVYAEFLAIWMADFIPAMRADQDSAIVGEASHSGLPQ